MPKETFKVDYDEQYIGPGCVIYREDYKKFLKLYTSNYYGFSEYNVTAKDEYIDREDMDFREIYFPIDSTSILYGAISRLYGKICNSPIMSIDSHNQGRNNLRVELNGDVYYLIASKDVYGVRHASDTVDILLGDNYSCKEWEAINEFYININQVAAKRETTDVAFKILKLKPSR